MEKDSKIGMETPTGNREPKSKYCRMKQLLEKEGEKIDN